MNELRNELGQYLPPDAADWCVSAYRLCQTWDDIIDTGTAPAEEVNAAFHDALIDWERNPFYVEHRQALVTLIGSAILQWHTANEIEKAKDKDLYAHSFMLRAAVFHLLAYAVYLVHDMATARMLAPRVYALYIERFEDYVTEIDHA